MKWSNVEILKMNHSTYPTTVTPTKIKHSTLNGKMCLGRLAPALCKELAVLLKAATRNMKNQYPSFNKIHHLDSSQGFKNDRMLLETINQQLYSLKC